MSDAALSPCSCGNSGCAKRLARGMLPFCSPELRARPSLPKAGWTSYAAAVAANPGRKVRWIGGGGTSGSPARFDVWEP